MLKHRRTTTPTKELGLSPSQPSGLSTLVGATKRSSSVPPKLDRTVAHENMAGGSEQSLVSVRASVVVYDDMYKKWVPSGEFPTGVSKVQIYHEPVNRTYRIVGRKIQDKEVTLNTMLSANIKYSEATPTFHQWRDSQRTIHGLNFSSKDDAVAFSKSILAVIRLLQHVIPGTQSQGRITPLDQQLHVEVATSTSSGQPQSLNTTTVVLPQSNTLLTSNGSVQQNGSSGMHVHPTHYQVQESRGRRASNSEPNEQTSNGDYKSIPIVTTNSVYRQPDSRSQTFAQVSSYALQPSTSTDPIQSFGFQPQGYPQSHDGTYQSITANNPYRSDIQYQDPQHQQQPSQNYYGSTMSTMHYNGHSDALSDKGNAGIYSTIDASTIPEPSMSLQQPAVHNGSQSFAAENGAAEKSEPLLPLVATSAPPPPPPPPAPPIPMGGIPTLPRSSTSTADDPQAKPMSNLAAALQSATLKKTPKVETSGIPPPLVGAKAVLMEEMQRKLARRKAKADGEDVSSNNCSARSSPFQNMRSNTTSPKPFNKPITRQESASIGDCTQDGSPAEALPPELEQLKQELLCELRKDLYQLKCEILAAIKEESFSADTR